PVNRDPRVRVLVRIDPDRHHPNRPFVESPDEADSRRTLFSWGSAKLLSSHARTSLTAIGRHHARRSATRRPNEGESARSRQGQSTTRANRATPIQLLTENEGAVGSGGDTRRRTKAGGRPE